MNHIDSRIGIAQKDDFNHSIANTSPFDKPFSITLLPRETATAMVYDPLYFVNRASMKRCMFEVPVVPAKSLHYSDFIRLQAGFNIKVA
jgi:hypothetical protein